MKYKVIIRPEAENDLNEACSWYKEKKAGLEHDFLMQIDTGLKLIAENPNIHPFEYKGTRKHLVKRFPYEIIYFFENEQIIVLAVLHGRRNPALIGKRKETI